MKVYQMWLFRLVKEFLNLKLRPLHRDVIKNLRLKTTTKTISKTSLTKFLFLAPHKPLYTLLKIIFLDKNGKVEDIFVNEFSCILTD